MFKPFVVVGIVFNPPISYCTVCGDVVVTSMQMTHEKLAFHGTTIPTGVSST